MAEHFKYYLILFLFGFYGYGFLEVLWRGFTHPTMSVAGGIAIIFIDYISTNLKELHILYRAIICGAFITAIEYIIGYVMNIKLGAEIWDYSLMPLNLSGQVCFSFSVLWCAISVPIMLIFGRKKRQKTPYLN
ncbi:MAG: hypothetical protein E7525_03725 [Ruminococcaceae bacterium]|nr:hypothetical protein [Oscillospiraceae bacterium]